MEVCEGTVVVSPCGFSLSGGLRAQSTFDRAGVGAFEEADLEGDVVDKVFEKYGSQSMERLL